MADDDFSLNGDSSNVESSLDDFFQPAEAPEEAPTPAPPAEGYEDTPIPKGAPLPDVPPVAAEPPPIPDEAGEPAEGGVRKFVSPKFLLILVIVLAVGVLGAGGYFAYTMFFAGKGESTDMPPPTPFVAKKPELPAPKPPEVKPETPPKEVKAPPAKLKAKPEKAAPDKPGKKKPAKTAETAKKPEGTAKATSPTAKKTPMPKKPAAAKSAEPTKLDTTPLKTASISTGPYTIQVGSYMMKESMTGPERKLKSLGYHDFHYVDTKRTLTVYDVFVGGVVNRAEADGIKADLQALGFKPSLKKQGTDSYKVLAYSYGSRSIANKSKAKIEKADIGKVVVKSERRRVTMHQLRVGHYPSSSKAKSSMSDLRKSGFDTILIKE